jgi:hypothetical protein
MTSRFGLALILIGTISLVVFLITYSNRQADLSTLLIGACLCILGLLLRRRAARRAKRDMRRFRMLRRWTNNDDENAV